MVALSGCSSGAPGGSAIAAGWPPSGDPQCSAGNCPAAPAPPGLFRGRLLVYSVHGFSAAEVAGITGAVRGPVTAVFSSEEMLRSGDPTYQLTPVAVLHTDPDSYAAAVGSPGLAKQLKGGLVLAAAEARLRQARTGTMITLADGRALPVTAVVDDHVIGGYEMATSSAVLATPATQPAAYLLVAGGASTAALTGVLHQQLPKTAVRVRSSTANGYFSAYDTVLPQLQVKRRFGEFSLRQAAGGTLSPDPAWRAASITSAKVVQLGQLSCSRALLPDLAAAMQEITDQKLGSLVHTADFQAEGGCFNPRATRSASGGSLSSHSWGMAVDINVDVNPLGAPPRQDPRLVAIMAAHGFSWGGRWLRPDGAHFEWVGTAIAAG
ncbi:MAG: hypothetical protein QOF39_1570 [Frankiales bacterium]|nr:hypothetical protein [Frankiales bacterium]